MLLLFRRSFNRKALILDRNDSGPDSSFSIEPGELEALVNEIRDAGLSLGGAGYDKSPQKKLIANLEDRCIL